MTSISRYYGSGSDTPNKAWVALMGRPAISLVNDTDAALEALAVAYWANADEGERAEAALRAANPGRQVYGGQLPARDVEWNGEPGWYMYVLKDRRARGKYQVLAVAK